MTSAHAGPDPASGAASPSGAGPSGARRPERAPSRAALAERDRFAALTSASLDSVRAAAQSWRIGLAAFVTLVTTGTLVVGRTVTAELDPQWRLAATLLVLGGLALAIAGFWLAIAAEAGTDSRKRTLQDIRAEHGTLAAYEVSLASEGAGKMRLGRWAVAVALACLLGGVAVIWWAPAAASSPPAYIRVSVPGTAWCGVLRSADGGFIRLAVAGRHSDVVIPLDRVSNLAVTASCR